LSGVFRWAGEMKKEMQITDVATGNLDFISMLFVLIHIVLGYGLLAALVTRFAIMFQSLSS